MERPMPYVRDSYWRGRTFTTLEGMQADAVRWSRDVAGARSCRPLDGAAPAIVFAAVEAPALGALPATPFVLATWASCKVGPDIHVKVGPALYSVPWRLMGQQVHARSTATMVQIIHEGAVVATHVRRERGRATNVAHYPPEKIAFHMRTPSWCRQVAAQVGPACTDVIANLLEVNALFRLRAAQGVLGLRGKHTPGLMDIIAEDDDLVIAAMTVAELRTGIELAAESHRAARAEFLVKVLESLPVEPYDLATAEAHGRLLAHVHRTGTKRGAHDLMIAATAVATKRTVLTTDRGANFNDLPGVDCIVVT